jgi:hypothetical protein
MLNWFLCWWLWFFFFLLKLQQLFYALIPQIFFHFQEKFLYFLYLHDLIQELLQSQVMHHQFCKVLLKGVVVAADLNIFMMDLVVHDKIVLEVEVLKMMDVKIVVDQVLHYVNVVVEA